MDFDGSNPVWDSDTFIFRIDMTQKSAHLLQLHVFSGGHEGTVRGDCLGTAVVEVAWV